jgi:hypothetical protein
MKDRVRAILRDYTFIEACDDYDKGAVDVLLIERGKLSVRNRGEVEAVVQAAEGTIVIVDDRWAGHWRRSTAAIFTELSGCSDGCWSSSAPLQQ